MLNHCGPFSRCLIYQQGRGDKQQRTQECKMHDKPLLQLTPQLKIRQRNMVIPSHKDRKSLWLTMFDCRGNRNNQDPHSSTFRKSPFLQGLLSCLNGLFPLEKEFKRHGIGCPLEQVFLDFQGIIDKCIHQRRVIQGIQILQYGHVKQI